VRPCPIFASYTLEFALQLRKKHGKTLVRVAARTSKVDTVQYKNNEQYTTQKKHSKESSTRSQNNKEHRIHNGENSPLQVSKPCVLLIHELGASRGWVIRTTPQPLYPRKRPGTHCTGSWVGTRVGLDVCEKFHPHRDSIPESSSKEPVATPTELSRPPITEQQMDGNSLN
jgi:hypothetical protein